MLVRERWRSSASRELIMRRYLNAAERGEYEALNPRTQRQWLLGRMAAKDAVRRWLWSHGAGPLFPAEIRVSNDERGRPTVAGPFGEDLRVSIAHKEGVAVAIICQGSDTGIDIEPIAPRSDRFAEMVLTDRSEHWRPRGKHLTSGSPGSGRAKRPPRRPAARDFPAGRATSSSIGSSRAGSASRRAGSNRNRKESSLSAGLNTAEPDPQLVQQILADVRASLIEVIGEDYLLDIPIDMHTSFDADLQLESVEFVALAERLAERYGDRVDFVGWFASMEVDELIFLRVGQLVEFIARCLS